MAPSKVSFEMDVVDSGSRYKAPRGRKTTQIPGLVEALATLKSGDTAILRGLGSFEKEKRSAISGTIRQHWKLAKGSDNAKCSVEFTPEGIPQVTEKVAVSA